MDSIAATRLAGHLSMQQPLCNQVSARLLQAYPELMDSLRSDDEAVARLSEVAVERLGELVRSMLLFELPALADQELRWAQGVLTRSGVTIEHQSSMIHWYFEELCRLPLSQSELGVAHELEQYMLFQVRQAFERS